MWRAGFDGELIAWTVNVIALALGAGMGLRALLDPRWAARFVRLVPDPAQAGGFAEFRASYGGFFFGAHAIALILSGDWLINGAFQVGIYATGVSAALAAAWGFAFVGRALSMLRDGTRTRFNIVSAVYEAASSLAIAAPLLTWLFSRPG